MHNNNNNSKTNSNKRLIFCHGLFRTLRLLLLIAAAFLVIPPAQFKLVLDSIIWGFKHTMRNVADTGLTILYQLLQNVAQADPAAAQSFYQTYYTEILQHIFSVVTDSSHTAGRILYCTLFAVVI